MQKGHCSRKKKGKTCHVRKQKFVTCDIYLNLQFGFPRHSAVLGELSGRGYLFYIISYLNLIEIVAYYVSSHIRLELWIVIFYQSKSQKNFSGLLCHCASISMDSRAGGCRDGAPVTQLVEHRAAMREVVSTTPVGPTLRVLK